MPQHDCIEITRDTRGVACVTVANAAKLNTLSRAVMTALIDAVEALAGEPSLRAVILRGAGARAFIGGADITEMATLNASSARDFITMVHRSCDVFRRLPVPVIARIQGYVLGAGLEVAASCDMRVAASDATFGMPEVRIGIPSVVEAALLPQLIGWGHTRQLLLTGETIDAAVEHRVAAILACGPRAISAQKSLIQAWENLPMRDAITHGIDSFAASWDSDEPARMMGEFLDVMRRRKPASA